MVIELKQVVISSLEVVPVSKQTQSIKVQRNNKEFIQHRMMNLDKPKIRMNIKLVVAEDCKLIVTGKRYVDTNNIEYLAGEDKGLHASVVCEGFIMPTHLIECETNSREQLSLF